MHLDILFEIQPLKVSNWESLSSSFVYDQIINEEEFPALILCSVINAHVSGGLLSNPHQSVTYTSYFRTPLCFEVCEINFMPG